MQWCQRLEADYGMNPWIWQSLDCPSFRHSSKFGFVVEYFGFSIYGNWEFGWYSSLGWNLCSLSVCITSVQALLAFIVSGECSRFLRHSKFPLRNQVLFWWVILYIRLVIFFLLMLSISFFLCILNVLIMICMKSFFSGSVYLVFLVLPVSSLWIHLSLGKCSSMILLES